MATLAEVKTAIEAKLPAPDTTWSYSDPRYVAAPPGAQVIVATAITTDASEESAAARQGIEIFVTDLGETEERAWVEKVPVVDESIAARFRREAEAYVRAAQHAGTYLAADIVAWHTALSCNVDYTKPNGQLELKVLYFDEDYVLQEADRNE
jgi:hypothetical protein